jgi:hypothetical protein
MIDVQLPIGLSDPLARLRAHLRRERSFNVVAADVIARRLRFER